MNKNEIRVKLLAVAGRIPELSCLTDDQKYKSLERLITDGFTPGKGSVRYDAKFEKVLNLSNEKFEGGNIADFQEWLALKTSPTAKASRGKAAKADEFFLPMVLTHLRL